MRLRESAARITASESGVLQPRDVGRDAAGEQLHVLRQVADGAAECIAVPARDVGAIQAHRAGLRLADAQQQPQQRGLARCTRADHPQALARGKR